jgi:tRNA dimethylallyltransferase
MLAQSFEDALVLTGPTGSGKTELAIALAQRLGAEIVSMDSMALYRGIDIGTAKPTPEQRRQVPHHLIDVLDPWESASVAWWRERAAACCRDIQGRDRRPLFVGGTPLYLRVFLQGLFQGPPADEPLRQGLAEEAERLGPFALHERLAKVDPAAAARLHPHDLRRVIRALEVWQLTGQPISSYQTQWDKKSASVAESPARVLWLDLPRAELYARINARVDRMFAAGLVEEARTVHRLRFGLSREASQALGYKEVFAYLDGAMTLQETIARVQTRTRNFAKRQITWFRHLPGCRAVSPELTEALWASTID